MFRRLGIFEVECPCFSFAEAVGLEPLHFLICDVSVYFLAFVTRELVHCYGLARAHRYLDLPFDEIEKPSVAALNVVVYFEVEYYVLFGFPFYHPGKQVLDGLQILSVHADYELGIRRLDTEFVDVSRFVFHDHGYVVNGDSEKGKEFFSDSKDLVLHGKNRKELGLGTIIWTRAIFSNRDTPFS